MVISNSRRFIFVHIPKTGGTSMTHALQEVIAWNDIVCGGTTYGQRLKDVWGEKWGIGKHATASAIRELVGQEIWDRYFTFSLVRHPADRMKSMYLWTERIVEWHGLDGWRRWARPFLQRYQHEMWEWPTVQAYIDTDSFAEYIRHPDLKEGLIVAPQSDFLTSEEGKEDLIVDRVFRLESINNHLDELNSRIGCQVQLPKRNVSNQSRSPDLRKTDVRRMGELYARDYSILDYQMRTTSFS